MNVRTHARTFETGFIRSTISNSRPTYDVQGLKSPNKDEVSYRCLDIQTLNENYFILI